MTDEVNGVVVITGLRHISNMHVRFDVPLAGLNTSTPLDKNFSDKFANVKANRFNIQCMAEMRGTVDWNCLSEEFMADAANRFAKQAHLMEEQLYRGLVVEKEELPAKRQRQGPKALANVATAMSSTGPTNTVVPAVQGDAPPLTLE